MLLRRLSFVGQLLCALCCIAGRLAIATTVNEISDAPETIPGQSTLSSGNVTTINGNISGLTDADIYAINITNPSTFSATVDNVVNYGDYPNSGLDTILSLFRADGTGVYANDDRGSSATFPGGYDITSQLTAGNPNGPTTPGTYYLAISTWRYAPVDALGNEIFANSNGGLPVTSDPGSGGLGPTSSMALAHWAVVGSEDGFNLGNYIIQLTGVGIAGRSVPEPGSVGLLAMAGVGLAGWFAGRRCTGSVSLSRRPSAAITAAAANYQPVG